MRSRYSIIIYTPQEYNHSSYIQTGLFELERESNIDVKIKLSLNKRKGKYIVDNNILSETNELNPKTSYYEIIDHVTKQKTLFACDLYDFGNHFSKFALEHCEYVFKRNYVQKNIDKLPVKHQQKVFKMGLTFGVHSNKHKGFFKFFIANFMGTIYCNIKLDRRILKRILDSLTKSHNHWKHIKTSRRLSLFDSIKKTVAQKKTILFQTRCFDSETDSDILAIHEQRNNIINLLRSQYPTIFNGGFVSSKISESKYPSAITNVPSDPLNYIEAVKNSSIVIYTRGLKKSPAWKMAEYCSQGKIIVAERLTAELPIDLIDDKHVLFFADLDEMLIKINLVLKNPSLGNLLSSNSREYYLNNIHPKQNMLRILRIMGCEI